MEKLCALLVVLMVGFGEIRVGEALSDRDLSSESRLMKQLKLNIAKFGTEVRPVLNSSEKMMVNFGMGLILIDKVDPGPNGDPNRRDVTFLVWHRYTWTDMTLRWNPNTYEGLTQIRIPSQYIWKPDLLIFNSLEISQDQKSMAVISSGGTVLWVPPTRIRIPCIKDSDSMLTCTIKYGSWTYDGNKLDIDFYDELEAIDINDFIRGNVEIVNNTAVKETKYYPCCQEPYPSLKFELKFTNAYSRLASSYILISVCGLFFLIKPFVL